MLPTVSVTRYVTPLREGGSLPGIVEGDDLGTYVCKFRGAGQGVRVLVAEVIVSELARRIGLLTPRLVALDLDPEIARYEADQEVQDLLKASAGLNLGVDYLPGSVGYDTTFTVDATTAARIVWLDAFVANVDRSRRNTNLLIWHKALWAIDHGACLRFHHAWGDVGAFAASAYNYADHVLVGVGDPRAVHAELAARVDAALLAEVLALVPDAWLQPDPTRPDPRAPHDAPTAREVYREYLLARLDAAERWLP